MHALGLGLLASAVLAVAGAGLLAWLWRARRAVRWPVAHLHLWREARPFARRQRRRWAELALFLGAFLAFVASAADLRGGSGPETTTWLVVDASPRLLARDANGDSPFEDARRRARETARALLAGPSAHARVGVVVRSELPRMLLSPTTDERAVARALDELAPDERPPFDEELARTRTTALLEDLRGQAAAVIHVFGARPRDSAAPAPSPGANTALVRVEVDAANRALVADVAAEDARWEGRTLVVSDAAARPARAPLVRSLEGERGTLLRVRVSLEPLGEPHPLRVAVHDARARAPLAHDDSLAVDWAPPRPLRVLRAGAKDTFLDAALRSLEGAVALVNAPPFDVVVSEGDTRAALPPEARDLPALLFAPARDGTTFRGRGEVTMSLLEEAKTSARHPAMAGLSLVDVNVGKLLRYDADAGDQLLASVKGAPAIFVRSHGATSRLVVAFAPGASDFPLRASFPLFVSQAVRWLGPAPRSTITWGWPAGAPSSATLGPTLTVVPPPHTPPRVPPAWSWLAGGGLLCALALLLLSRRTS